MTGYRIGFDSMDHETDVASLPVEGKLPRWLSGTLLRNGPALYDVPTSGRPKTFRHWFDGQAMVHRFTIDAGKVAYRNRFLRTEAFRSVREQGKISFTEFATDPCGSIFNRFFNRWKGNVTDNACVNITNVGDRVVALSETPMPVEFEPDTLATVGVVDFGDGHGRGGPTSAHPHVEPRAGTMVNYSLSFSRESAYRVYRVRDERFAREQIARYGTHKPGYMHSFAITENYVVLAVYPFVANPLSFLFKDKPFIENFGWEPELGTRIVVISLADGSVRGEYTTDAFFAFHHINAFEQDGELVMDVCAYDDAEIIHATYVDKLRGMIPAPLSYAVRYRVDLDGGTVSAARLSEEPFELPRINYGAHNGRPYQYAYGAGATDREGGNFLDQLLKLDTATGKTKVWRAPGCYPGEPVFVPAPSASREDDGVVLSVVLNAAAADSSLLVLDARKFQVLASANIGHPIPFGFHGHFTHP